MFHSSVVPIGLPVSLVVGVIAYYVLHGMGNDAAQSVYGAQVITGIVNAVVGIPKNLIVGDILSLVFVRPLSAIAAIALVGHWMGTA